MYKKHPLQFTSTVYDTLITYTRIMNMLSYIQSVNSVNKILPETADRNGDVI
jgi:hypothetical protein